MLRVRSKEENLTFITAILTSYFSDTFWRLLHVDNSLWGGRVFSTHVLFTLPCKTFFQLQPL